MRCSVLCRFIGLLFLYGLAGHCIFIVYFVVSHVLYCLVSRFTASCCMVLHCISLYSYGMAWYGFVQYGILLYCIVM